MKHFQRTVVLVIAVISRSLPAQELAARDGATRSLNVPVIVEPWWEVAGNPDVGRYTTSKQQPVDFSIWQAADGTWQLWSCVRGTKYPGKTRLFYGWEGKRLTDANWKPQGIKMTSDTSLGETEGGLQAPHVVFRNGVYYMLYGDWEHICLATSRDGKNFTRQIRPDGKTGIFTEGNDANTRDAFALLVGDTWHVYYTAFPNKQGVDYCRTSPDLREFSESRAVAFGGRAGTGPFSAECPHVVKHGSRYYLFRTQHYAESGGGARTSVYGSTDPLVFGINQDEQYFVTELPVAAPEIIEFEGDEYIAALLPNLQGIRIAKLAWTSAERR